MIENIIDVNKLNSMTKYPEILTYHKMGDRGRLLPECSVQFNIAKAYHMSEKVDGTNTRMIFINDRNGCDYFIGSREEILYAKGDRVINPALDIVENLMEKCKEISIRMPVNNLFGVYIIFAELYGGKLPANKQYTTTRAYNTRVFDIVYISLDEYKRLMEFTREEISQWRQRGGQNFYHTASRGKFCEDYYLERVPFIENVYGEELPIGIEETYEFLTCFKKSKAGIDCTGHSEGVVIRSDDRSLITKLRFEDYERTLGIKRT